MRDPKMIVLDEVVAVPLVFIGMGGQTGLIAEHGGWRLVGWLCNLSYIRYFKTLWHRAPAESAGGLGCAIDDMAAGLAACITLHLIMHFCFSRFSVSISVRLILACH